MALLACYDFADLRAAAASAAPRPIQAMHCSGCGLILGKELPAELCRCPRCERILRVRVLDLEDPTLERSEFVAVEGARRRFADLFVSEAWLRFDLPARTRRPEAWEPLLVELEEERLKAFAIRLGWVVAAALRDPGPRASDGERPFGRIGADLREGIANAILVSDFGRVPRRDLAALRDLARSHGGELLALAPHAPEIDLRFDHVDHDDVPDPAADLASLERLWGPKVEAALAGLMETAGWHWSHYAADAAAHAMGVEAIRAWRESGAPAGRPWKETLRRFVVARARRAGLVDRLALPALETCALCRRRFLDAALPPRLMELAGGRKSWCGRCLGRAFFHDERSGAWVGPPELDSPRDAEAGVRWFRELTRERFHAFLRGVHARSEASEQSGDGAKPSDLWLDAVSATGALAAYGAVVRSEGYFRAADGHLAASLGAALLDNWLAARGIAHRVDVRYPVDEELNPASLVRADLAAEGVLVEFVGMRGRDEFAKRIDQRLEIARRNGRALVALWADDLLGAEVVERKAAPILAAQAARSRESDTCPS